MTRQVKTRVKGTGYGEISAGKSAQHPLGGRFPACNPMNGNPLAGFPVRNPMNGNPLAGFPMRNPMNENPLAGFPMRNPMNENPLGRFPASNDPPTPSEPDFR